MTSETRSPAFRALEAAAERATESVMAALEAVARQTLRDNPLLTDITSAQGLDAVTLDGERLIFGVDEVPDSLAEWAAALDVWDSVSPGTSPGIVMNRDDAAEPEPEPDTFAAFIRDTGLTMTRQAVAHRPDDAAENFKDSLHFLVTIHKPAATPGGAPGLVWSGFYSVGSGWPETWAREGCKVPGTSKRDRAARLAYQRLDEKRPRPGGRLSVHDAAQWAIIRERFQAVAPVSLESVLISLQGDSRDWELTFEDWADSLGYDTDSRRAESIFRACQDTAKTIRAAFGPALFNRFLDLEES